MKDIEDLLVSSLKGLQRFRFKLGAILFVPLGSRRASPDCFCFCGGFALALSFSVICTSNLVWCRHDFLLPIKRLVFERHPLSKVGRTAHAFKVIGHRLESVPVAVQMSGC